MKIFKNLQEFRKSIEKSLSQNGLQQQTIDEFYVNCLERCRIAAAMALPLLRLSVTPSMPLQELIRGCEKILADKKVFILSAEKNDGSLTLEKTVKYTDKIILQVGNFFNNHYLNAKPELKELLIGARVICDLATKRIRIGS